METGKKNYPLSSLQKKKKKKIIFKSLLIALEAFFLAWTRSLLAFVNIKQIPTNSSQI
jgi:hypothetical protein